MTFRLLDDEDTLLGTFDNLIDAETAARVVYGYAYVQGWFGNSWLTITQFYDGQEQYV